MRHTIALWQMRYACLLMPGIPVSDGTLPPVSQHVGQVNGKVALLTDLKPGDWQHGEELWLYTATQHIEEADTPRVRFSKRQMTRTEMTPIDGALALVDNEFADPMKGWALVRIVRDRCSPQAIQTRYTLYQPYTTEEALQEAAKTYGRLTESLSSRQSEIHLCPACQRVLHETWIFSRSIEEKGAKNHMIRR